MSETTKTASEATGLEKRANVTFKWTDERVDILKQMWGTGCSAADIAAVIGEGVTRNAVIGKAHRLGLKSAPAKKQQQLVTVLDLSDRICRWPLGDPKKNDFHFCGAKIERGMRYCARHRELAFQNPNKKKEEGTFEGPEGPSSVASVQTAPNQASPERADPSQSDSEQSASSRPSTDADQHMPKTSPSP